MPIKINKKKWNTGGNKKEQVLIYLQTDKRAEAEKPRKSRRKNQKNVFYEIKIIISRYIGYRYS